MKRTLLGCFGAVVAASLLTGCLVVPVQPPTGIVYSDYRAPLDYDQEGLPMGSRTGMSESISILGLVALGDASIDAAATNGGISNVHGADYEYFNVLGVYQKYVTIVNGE